MTLEEADLGNEGLKARLAESSGVCSLGQIPEGACSSVSTQLEQTSENSKISYSNVKLTY